MSKHWIDCARSSIQQISIICTRKIWKTKQNAKKKKDKKPKLEPELNDDFSKENWFNSVHHEKNEERIKKCVANHEYTIRSGKGKIMHSFVVHWIKRNSGTLIKNCGSFASFKWQVIHERVFSCFFLRIILN